MELIDREALLRAYDAEHKGPAGRARELIEEAPTADAVEVVRCKDCKYHEDAFCHDHKTVSKTEVYCFRYEDRHSNNWFCAAGERKEE